MPDSRNVRATRWLAMFGQSPRISTKLYKNAHEPA
jgi:hypothetical protein